MDYAASLFLLINLTAIAAIDLREFRIPNACTSILFVSGLLLTFILQRHSIISSIAASCLGFSVLYVLRLMHLRLRGVEGLGLGDVKLIGAAGVWIGIERLPFAILAGSSLALLWILAFHLLWAPWSRDKRLQFGPFLAAGIAAAWFWPLPTLGN